MNIKNTWLVQSPIAHRGLHTAEIPENSLAAFTNAITHGYPIELDVRLTDDNVLIVFHDDSLKRMANSDGYITNVKSSELNDYHLLGTDQTIPTFEKVLETVNGHTPILIEIKNTGKVGLLESKLLEVLNGYNGKFAVQSFNPYSLEFFKQKAPGILRGQLSAMLTKEEQSSWIRRFFLSRLKLNNLSKPDFIAYRAENLPNKYVTRTGLPVLAWTVRSNADFERARTAADNIIFEKFIPIVTKEMPSTKD